MRILRGEEKKFAEECLERAIEIARNSSCLKSQRGVVIARKRIIIGTGYNTPPEGYNCETCLREEVGKIYVHTEPCRATHAERKAIMDAWKNGVNPKGSVMYHIKVKNGLAIASGQPSCTMCAKDILDAKIEEFVLWHKEGITAYTARENLDISLESIKTL